MRRALSNSPVLLPAAAAVVAFLAALALGMTTKSSSSPQTATSLAPPVSIQAPQASVAALQRAVPTPALKQRTPPAKPHPAAASSTVAPAPSTTSAPPPSTGVTRTPTGGVIHSPTTGVVHSPSSGVVHNSGGGSGVVHGGN